MSHQFGGPGPFSIPTPPHQSKNSFLDDLEKQIIGSLQGKNNGLKVADLTRLVGKRTKKEINPTLYKLERRGMIRKVNDKPPVWLLLRLVPGTGNTQGQGISHGTFDYGGNVRGRVRGRGRRGRGGWGHGKRGHGYDGYHTQDFSGLQMGYGSGRDDREQGRGFVGPSFPGDSWSNFSSGGVVEHMGVRSRGFRGGSKWSSDSARSGSKGAPTEDTAGAQSGDHMEESRMGDGEESELHVTQSTDEQLKVGQPTDEGEMETNFDKSPENRIELLLTRPVGKDSNFDNLENRIGSPIATGPLGVGSGNKELSGTSSSDDSLVHRMDYDEMRMEMSRGGQGAREDWGEENETVRRVDDYGRRQVQQQTSGPDWHGTGTCNQTRLEHPEESSTMEGGRVSPEPMDAIEIPLMEDVKPTVSSLGQDVPPSSMPSLSELPGFATPENEPLQKRAEVTERHNPYSASGAHSSREEGSDIPSIPMFPHQIKQLEGGSGSGGKGLIVNQGFGRGLPPPPRVVGFGRGSLNSSMTHREAPGGGRGLSSSVVGDKEANPSRLVMGRGISRLLQSKLPGSIPPPTPVSENSRPNAPPTSIPAYSADSLPLFPSSMDTSSSTSLEQKIIHALSGSPPTQTIDLARQVCGKKATCKDVNPTLYGMEQKGLLRKLQNQPPMWCLSETVGTSQVPEQSQGGELGIPKPQSEQITFSSGTSTASFGSGSSSPEFLQRMGGPSSAGGASLSLTIPQPPAALLNIQHSMDHYGAPCDSTRSGASTVTPHTVVAPPASLSARPSNDVAETMRLLNKNPISAFMEFAQSVQQQPSLEMVGQAGPPHRPKFTFIARVGRRSFPPVVTSNKKEGRREAAEAALRMLAAEGAFQSAPSKASQPGEGGTTFYDVIATLAHQTFNSLVVNIPECFSGKKVIAALILKTDVDDDGRVIALGTGNRCLTGDKLSLEGQAVHDSHAEVVTRRAFMGYLYRQLRLYHTNPQQTILTQGASGKLVLRPGHTLHLYISTAPCGDGAQFSWTDNQSNQEGPPGGPEFNGCAHHTPTIEKNIQGLLRTKMELGEGTIPIQEKNPIQTWDAILQNQQRLRTMSCSDKVCRWNILGLQGSLLGNFVEPIYMSSLTLGALYHHGHLARAVCCRMAHYHKTVGDTAGQLPASFRINHPQLGHVTSPDPPRGTEKTKEFSVNWFAGCAQAEVTDGTVGRIKGVVPSRLCKMNLLKEYMGVCALYGRPPPGDPTSVTYNDLKQSNGEYQQAKDFMTKLFRRGKAGTWVHKPVEVEMFPP